MANVAFRLSLWRWKLLVPCLACLLCCASCEDETIAASNLTTPAPSVTTPAPNGTAPAAIGTSPTTNITPVSTDQSGGGGTSTGLIIGLSVGGAALLVLVLGGLAFLFTRPKGRAKSLSSDSFSKDTLEAYGPPEWVVPIEDFRPPHRPAPVEASLFTYQELIVATDEFDERNLLGEGGFGRVYRGVVPSGVEVAVKRLEWGGRQGEKEFRVEVDMLSRLNGCPYLLNLVGYCADSQHRVLVYDYMPLGSLQSHLYRHGRDRSDTEPRPHAPLDWPTRLGIALDVARGIDWLHTADPPVIHRDLKSSNVLLDNNFNARVADFGLAKVGDSAGAVERTTRLLGTQGYVAPEYALAGLLTTKSDVYSYGVVLLELITGQPPVDNARDPERSYLVTWVLPLINHREQLLNVVDPDIQGQFTMKDLIQVAAIAAMCVQGEADHRPLMSDIVQSLLPVVRAVQCSRKPKSTDAAKLKREFISREYTTEEILEPLRNSGSVPSSAQEKTDELLKYVPEWQRHRRTESSNSGAFSEYYVTTPARDLDECEVTAVDEGEAVKAVGTESAPARDLEEGEVTVVDKGEAVKAVGTESAVVVVVEGTAFEAVEIESDVNVVVKGQGAKAMEGEGFVKALDEGKAVKAVETEGDVKAVDEGEAVEAVKYENDVKAVDEGEALDAVETEGDVKVVEEGEAVEAVQTGDVKVVEEGEAVEAVETEGDAKAMDEGGAVEAVETEGDVKVVDEGKAVEAVETEGDSKTGEEGSKATLS